ncbi:MAG: hypothetical protein RJA50_462, partial [Actinomycetota bacterium]
RHVIESINLPVWMVDSCTNFSAAVFENQDILHITAAHQCVGAVGPKIDNFFNIAG